jgi:hypothetical protein
MARAAYERELNGLTVPAPEGVAPKPLSPRDRWDLDALTAHRTQLVTATTVPGGSGS